MPDIDQLVRRTVDSVESIAAIAGRFALRLFLLTTVVCVGGFLLGVAALSGGIETVWIVLAIVFGSIAVGGSFLALWRVWSVRRHTGELAGEVRTLVETRGEGPTRTVIDSFVVDVDENGNPQPGQGSAIMMSRQMGGFQQVAGPDLAQTVHLATAVRALTTFPLFALAAIAISMVFGFLGVIFLIALAL